MSGSPNAIVRRTLFRFTDREGAELPDYLEAYTDFKGDLWLMHGPDDGVVLTLDCIPQVIEFLQAFMGAQDGCEDIPENDEPTADEVCPDCGADITEEHADHCALESEDI